MKVLITGASGFIGSFLVEKGLELGYEVWAGMRGKSSKKFLPSTGVKYVELDFSSSDSMRRQLARRTTTIATSGSRSVVCVKISQLCRTFLLF